MADALIDYNAIQDGMEFILQQAAENDGQLEGAAILVEEEPQFGLMDKGVCVCLFMDNRDASSAEQLLGAGKRTRYHLRVTYWVVAFDLSDYRSAVRKRNATLSQLESVLMKNRKIEYQGVELAESSWLEGGTMFSAKDSQNSTFAAAAEVVQIIEVSILNA